MILDIKTLADSLSHGIGNDVKNLEIPPHLTIIQIGDDSASEVYVRNKIRMCETVGIRWTLLNFKNTITEWELITHIKKINNDNDVDGILVQSPLPAHMNPKNIFDTIHPLKDVDGFSSTNIAQLYSGDTSGLVPGTPKWIVKIIEQQREIEWKNIVIVGKSTIVGKPLAMLLLNAWATVTLCHSRTKNLWFHTKNADIVICAVWKKNLITSDMISENSLVIDVGINVEETTEGRKIFGDCDTKNIAKIADITPVPGGVWPMTIAMLLQNVLLAHKLQWKN